MSYRKNQNTIKNVINEVDTNYTSVTVSTNVISIPGSEMFYTPTSNSTKVIYECHTQYSWSPDGQGSYMETSFQYSTDEGSTWQDFENCQLFEGTFSNVNEYFWSHRPWIFIVDAWSGQRKIRLSIRSWNANSEFTLGAAYDTYPSNSYIAGSSPHISVYCI